MNPNLYIFKIINKYRISQKDRLLAAIISRKLYPNIKKWAKNNLLGIITSGSYAKNTGISGNTDIDLLISLHNQTPHTLEEIYNSLYNNFLLLNPRKQNVSIRIKFENKNIDLVPAKKMPNLVYPHSIYLSKSNSWTKTNIIRHISTIRDSKRINEIILVKIWKDLNKLEFPSFYLELSVIEALKENKVGFPYLENNISTIFEYLSDNFLKNRIIDPANSNNIISDTINALQKKEIVKLALNSIIKPNWNDIIW